MGMWSRVLLIFRVKSATAMGKAENPLEVLSYADEQQQELLRKVKQGLIEVAISKRQLQQQVEKLKARIPQMEDQARRAVSAGREDMARVALKRKQTATLELANLEAQAAEMGEEENRLVMAEHQLAARIEEFRMHRRTMTARYTAAEAQVRVNEAMSGVSQDFATLGMAVGRAEERIERMMAHASAIDALVDSGVLEMPVSSEDIVERELREITEREVVNSQLASLQAELGIKGILDDGQSSSSR